MAFTEHDGHTRQ